ncbi:uncharacterized protein [Ptychodera flava]|uniref:uncharacterized protein isoform X3 n=1 Tax=Ptychodera flava TaxID=63121 RepID=UPI003969CEDA
MFVSSFVLLRNQGFYYLCLNYEHHIQRTSHDLDCTMSSVSHPESSINVKVAIRVRPCISREEGQDNYWQVDDARRISEVDSITKKTQKSYYFDRVFSDNESTSVVYDEIALPIVDGAMDGYNGTIFAYGQTSSGKTYTMQGSDSNPGIILRAVSRIFENIEKTPGREFLLRISYAELYNEELRDLLSNERKTLTIREDGKRVFVQNLSEEMVTTNTAVIDLLKKGEARRHIAGTNMNEHSSRSHTIFCIIIESREIENSDLAVKVAHLNLVDLAGSERANETGAEGTRLQEACKINQSLFCLGQVINKLSSQSSAHHIPYRASKLTRMLQTSLGGNAKTAIICTVTPAAIGQTHSTLQFASSAKTIQNKPEMNEVLSDEAMLRKCRKEIQALKNKISKLESNPLSGHEVLQEQLEKERTEKEKLKELLQVEQEDKINQLKKLIIVSSVTKVNEQKSKFNRRQTWCPGSRKPFFPPIAAPKSIALSSVIESSVLNDSLDSVSSDVSTNNTTETIPEETDFCDASNNSVFISDCETKQNCLEITATDHEVDLMPPPAPLTSAFAASSLKKRRRGNQVHFAEVGVKLVQPEVEDVACQTDFTHLEEAETDQTSNSFEEVQDGEEVSDLKKRIENFMAENLELRQNLCESEERIEDLTEQISELEAGIKQENGGINAVSGELTEEISSAEQERNVCASCKCKIIDNDVNENDNNDGENNLKKQLEDLQSLLDTKDLELNVMKDLIGANDKEKLELQENHVSTVAALNEKVQELEGKLSESRSNVAATEHMPISDISQNEDLNILKQKNQELQQELEETVDLCENLVMDKSALQENHDKLQTDYKKLKDHCNQLMEDLTKSEEEQRELKEFHQEELNMITLEYEETKGCLNGDVQEEIESLKSILAETERIHKESVTKLHQVQQENEEIIAEKQIKEHALTELQTELAYYKSLNKQIPDEELASLDSLKRSLADSEVVILDANKKLHEVKAQNESLKAEIANMQVDKLKKTIESLTKSLSDAELFAMDTSKKLSQKITENERLKAQLESSDVVEDSNHVHEEIEHFKQLANEATQKHENVSTTVESLEQSLSDAKETIRETREECQNLKSQNAGLQTEIETLSSAKVEEINQLDQEVENHKRLYNEISEKYSSLLKNFESIKLDLSGAEMVAMESNKKVSQLESENEKLSGDISRLKYLEDEATRLAQELDIYKGQSSKLAEENDELIKRIQSLENLHTDVNLVTKETDVQLSQLNSENEDLKLKIAHLEGKAAEVRNLEQELEYQRQASVESEKLNKTVEMLKEKLKDAEVTASDAEMLITDLKAQNESLKEKSAHLEGKAAEVRNLEQELEYQRQVSSEASVESEKLNKTVEMLKEKLKDAEVTASDAEMLITDLKAQNESLKEKSVFYENKLCEVQHLECQVEHYKSLCMQISTRHDTLLDEVKELKKRVDESEMMCKEESEKVIELKRQHEAHSNQLESYIASLEGDLAKLQEESGGLQMELTKQQEISEHYELESQRSTAEMSKMTDELQSFSTKNQELQKKLLEIQESQMISCAEETGKLEAKISEVQMKLNKEHEMSEYFESENKRLAIVMSEKDDELEDFSQKNRELEDKVSETQNEYTTKCMQNEELGQTLSITKQRLNEMENMEKQLLSEKADLVRHIEELKEKENVQANCMQGKHDEKEKLEAKITELQQRLVKEQEMSEYFESENKRFAIVMSEMDDELEDLSEKNRKLEDQLSEIQASCMQGKLDEKEKLEAKITEVQQRLVKEHEMSEYFESENKRFAIVMSEMDDELEDLSEKNRKLEDQLSETQGKLKTSNNHIVEMEEELSRKTCHENHEDLKTLQMHLSEKNAEIYKLRRDVLLSTEPLEKEIQYLNQQLIYHKQLSQQYHSELKEEKEKCKKKPDTEANPSSEMNAEKQDYFSSSTGVVDKLVSSVLKAQKGQLERELTKMKSKNELLERQVNEQGTFFQEERMKRKYFESEAEKWKSKAKELYQKVKERGLHIQGAIDKIETPLQDVKADGSRINSPMKEPRNIEKIPIKKKVGDSVQDDENGQTGSESKSNWLQGTKFTQAAASVGMEEIPVDKPECKTQ